ncbi:hypothetical protein FOA43_004012 [Brettanomyces nanus]|uniref:2-dehydropantoate 2-reductase n=1 Tax=Eeniella nana TaxID=13502 RepID=A0A875RQD6_EENNA|nr:uncharacterized protein FOA43_004012 [Brettanomyces nanus]QPG76620.1 hypothetical protein FOA43_004012 [Brettanomyces nanus]
MQSVYILGAGGIGCLVAAPLVGSFKVNFIVRSSAKKEYLEKHDYRIQFKELFDGGRIKQYKINGAYYANEIPDKHICCLIVSVKTFNTVSALKSLMDRIDKTTEIVLVQNGMGVIDQLYEELWPDEKVRPIFYQAVISHGVYQDIREKNTYNYIHAGFSGMKLCRLTKDFASATESNNRQKATEMIRTLVNSQLNVEYCSYQNLLVYQVQKLIMNCCMNSITSILDCVNYELDNLDSPELFKEIVEESMKIFDAAFPILKNSELYESILTIDNIVNYTVDCGLKVNAKNSTSMRQDVLNLRDIEIDYINGYVVKLGKRVGIPAKVNHAIVLLVKIRLQINRARVNRKDE